MTIAFFDVDYRKSGARVACVLAKFWMDTIPMVQYSMDIASVAAYEPGNFFRRELPCLLALLQALPVVPHIVVIDGYVWLTDESRKGLGAHLYDELSASIPVIGVAKTAFADAASSSSVAKVIRGKSIKPLFVTAIGTPLETARDWVQNMAGEHRIPSLLTAVDQLSRSNACALTPHSPS